MLVNSKKLLEKIKPNRALCALNFSTKEVAETIVKTASSLKAPFILQTSTGEASFLDPETAADIAQNLSQEYQFDFSLNLDHGHDLNLVKECLKYGYSSIHFDGSRLPFPENVSLTKQVVALCRPKKVCVEGELGQIPGSSSFAKNQPEGSLTSPDQVVQFIKETQVDFLAISVGEKHGLGKANLDFNLLKKIADLTNTPLVLHGGSGISQELLKKAINLGIKKINFNTELRLAWTQSLRDFLSKHANEIVPYKILPSTEKKISQIVTEKLKTCTL